MRTGAAQMAVDELLFHSAGTTPVLRVYRWPARSASFGYASRWDNVCPTLPEGTVEAVRRWTGGGTVPHGDDLTYTLVLPEGAVAGLGGRSLGVYARAHQAMVDALLEAGVAARLADDGTGLPGLPCFVQPARHDVMVGARKLAGAGQRRTRAGILHQGSLRDEAAFVEVVLAMAARLGDCLVPLPPASIPDDGAVYRLAAERYANPAWTRMR